MPLCAASAGVTALPSIASTMPPRWFDLVDLPERSLGRGQMSSHRSKPLLPVDEEAIDAGGTRSGRTSTIMGRVRLRMMTIAAPERGLVAFLERGFEQGFPEDAATCRPRNSRASRAPGSTIGTKMGLDIWREGEVLRALVHALEVRGRSGASEGHGGIS